MNSRTRQNISAAFGKKAAELLSRIPVFDDLPSAIVCPRDTMHDSWHVDLFPNLQSQPESFQMLARQINMQQWAKPDGINLITVLTGWIPLRWINHKSDNVFVIDVPIGDHFYNAGLYIRTPSNFLSHEPRVGDTIRSELEQNAMWDAVRSFECEDCSVSGICLSVPMHLAQDLEIAG